MRIVAYFWAKSVFLCMLVGAGAGDNAVNAAAVALLAMLHDCQHIGRNEAMTIKQMFGPFPATAATAACTSVQSLLKRLPHIEKRLVSSKACEYPMPSSRT